jgi:hypothetical protein
MFSKNIRALYLYAVCFASLAMMVGGTIGTVSAIASYFTPMASVSPVWRPAHVDELSEEEIRRWEILEDDRREQQRENERLRSLRSIFNSSAFLIIGTPIFILHWRKVHKEEVDSTDVPS